MMLVAEEAEATAIMLALAAGEVGETNSQNGSKRTARRMSDLGLVEYVKLAIFYASYLYFPAAAFLVWAIARRRGLERIAAAIIIAALTLAAYARFVEPRILLTVEHDASLARCFPEAGSARLALFSDAHQGLFRNAVPISRIARRLNDAKPDAAFIAGDSTYFLGRDRFRKTFAPLSLVKAPVFAVEGNHDVGLPGPDVVEPLTDAFRAARVTMLVDRKTTVELNGAEIEVVGLSELWAGAQDRSLLEKRGARPRLALVHNPDTILHLRPREAVDLMLAGHTHGGQINIPFLTCIIMPGSCRVTRYGLVEQERGLVFVTSGTGMVGLPMRLAAAPRIDVINVTWNACGGDQVAAAR